MPPGRANGMGKGEALLRCRSAGSPVDGAATGGRAIRMGVGRRWVCTLPLSAQPSTGFLRAESSRALLEDVLALELAKLRLRESSRLALSDSVCRTSLLECLSPRRPRVGRRHGMGHVGAWTEGREKERKGGKGNVGPLYNVDGTRPLLGGSYMRCHRRFHGSWHPSMAKTLMRVKGSPRSPCPGSWRHGHGRW